ncbi:hypothetical protein KA012_00025 [Candidatus Woesebacteria bacterium]|nr:hypothetical protein [Candidatus Woesebacteria bacterium]
MDESTASQPGVELDNTVQITQMPEWVVAPDDVTAPTVDQSGNIPPLTPTSNQELGIDNLAGADQDGINAESASQRSLALFSEEKGKFDSGIKSTTTANYVLDRYARDAEKSGQQDHPFASMSSEGAAALLLRLSALESGSGEDAQLNSALHRKLKQRIDDDPKAAKVFYEEQFATLTPEQFITNVEAVTLALSSSEWVSGHQLRQLLEKSQELKGMGTIDSPQLETQIEQLDAEYRRRALVLEELASISEEDVNVAINQASSLEATSNITGLVRDGDTLTVESTTAAGELTQVEVKKPNLTRLFFLMSMADAIMGTRVLEQVGGKLAGVAISPLLEKWGIDPAYFNETMGFEQQYAAFDQHLEVMSDQQCEQFFSASLERRILPEVLRGCHPDHIKNIFDPAGTKVFRSRTPGVFNGHLLSQTLVDRMRASLSTRQRADLKIPDSQTK